MDLFDRVHDHPVLYVIKVKPSLGSIPDRTEMISSYINRVSVGARTEQRVWRSKNLVYIR